MAKEGSRNGRFRQKYTAMKEIGFWKYVFVAEPLRIGGIFAILPTLTSAVFGTLNFSTFVRIVMVGFFIGLFFSIFSWLLWVVICGSIFNWDPPIKSGKQYNRLIKNTSWRMLGICAGALLAFMLLLTLLTVIFFIPSKTVYPSEYDFVINPVTNTITHDIRFVLNDTRKMSYVLKTSGIELSVFDWEQIEGRNCSSLLVSNYTLDETYYTTFVCNYKNSKPYGYGSENITLRAVSECGKYCHHSGTVFWGMPYSPKENSTRDLTGVYVSNTIFAPKGYEFVSFLDLAFKGYRPKQNSSGIFVSMGKLLTVNDSLDNPLFTYAREGDFSLRRVVNFSVIKTITEGKVTIFYPQGLEEDSQALLDDVNRVFPEFERYSGYVEYDNIEVRFVESYSDTGGYEGFASIPTNYEQRDANITIYVTMAEGTILHELCHLSQKPFRLPSWFGEGQASNCGEVRLMNLLGKYDEAKANDKSRIDSARIASGSIDLANWGTKSKLALEDEQATLRGYGLSYMLMKEVLNYVDMSAFYIKIRSELVAYIGHGMKLPNDIILCKLNEVAKSDILPIFRKYGFQIDSCNNLEICSSNQIYGEDSDDDTLLVCANRCTSYFCKSRVIDTSRVTYCSPGFGPGTDGKCHAGYPANPCPYGSVIGPGYVCMTACTESQQFCDSNTFCYKNRDCIRCPAGETLYDNGYCY